MCHEILKTFFFLAQSVKTILDSKAIGQQVGALDYKPLALLEAHGF